MHQPSAAVESSITTGHQSLSAGRGRGTGGASGPPKRQEAKDKTSPACVYPDDTVNEIPLIQGGNPGTSQVSYRFGEQQKWREVPIKISDDLQPSLVAIESTIFTWEPGCRTL